MTPTNIRFTADLPVELKGDRWEVVFVEEGPFVDGKHYVTRQALEAAQASKLFDGVYVQELMFRDGTTRHLPNNLDQSAPGGVFGNAVAITADTALRTLADGRAAIIGFIETIDDTWRNKMMKIVEKGRNLPGVSFNCLIPVAGLCDRVVEAGRTVREIVQFGNKIDSFEIVTYPNAGGQVLRAVADQTASCAGSPLRQLYLKQMIALYT